MNLSVGAHVFVGADEYSVVGPGRGEGWAILTWIDDSAARCYGTFHESQITVVQRSILLSGQSNAVRCVPPDLSAYGVTVIKSARDSSSITRWLPGGSERAGMYAAIAGTDVQKFWWINGEQDSLDSVAADAYESRLVALLADLRATLGKPALRASIALLNSALSRTYAPVVRAAQVAVCAADELAEPFDMDDVPGFDGLHYSAAGNIAMGVGLGNAYIATL